MDTSKLDARIERLRQSLALDERRLAEWIARDAEYRAAHGDKEADRVLMVGRKYVARAKTWLAKAEALLPK
jgi:hypothetical protein